MRRELCFAAFVAAASAAACSGAPPDDAPDYEVLPSTGIDGGGEPADAGADATAADAAAPVTYRTVLPATDTFPFGGGAYCNYEITLENVQIELTVLASGQVTGGSVQNVARERAIECKYPPSPPSTLTFTFDKAVATPSGARVDFAGARTNSPKTSLVAELTRKADGYTAIFSWKRTDQAPALNWAVTATVTLTSR